ncbi:MAG: cupin domain-containing protein [Gammaproteobacteria bacterium]|nr:cupin domain-containing protein [Gammaproteobacteria bacterium]
MRINADFSVLASVHTDRIPWLASPMPGVKRKMLDRIGEEVARATSIVRYAPGSVFAPHTHTGGEEFLVLSGVFQDEHGDYPAGSYVRNPPQSRHTPGSEAGCTIFVKLWQFDLADRTAVRLRPDDVRYQPVPNRAGVLVGALHEDSRESVRLEHWSPGAKVHLNLPRGGEILVLSGSYSDAEAHFGPYDWARFPVGSHFRVVAGGAGAHVWVKTGHLAHFDSQDPVPRG